MFFKQGRFERWTSGVLLIGNYLVEGDEELGISANFFVKYGLHSV